MKKYINILFAAAVSALALVSCVKEQEVKPGTPDAEDCQGVYFPKQDIIEETQIFDPTQEKVAIIKVARGVSEGALTLAPKVSLSEITSAGTVDGDVSLFTVSDIVFEDGQTETEIEIEFPEVKEGVQYSLHLAVEGDQYTSKYSSKVNTCDFKVMCVAYQDFLNPVTKEPAKVTFKQGWWGETHTAYIKYYEVDGIRHCQTYDEALVGEGNTKGGFWGMGEDQHLTFLWYRVDDPKCSDCGEKHTHTIPAGYEPAPEGAEVMTFDGYQEFDFGWSSGKPVVVDYYYYQLENGYPRPYLHFLDANSLYDNASYYDGNGGFYFWILGYNTVANPNSGWSFPEDYDIIGIAEGFTRADYSLKLDAGITEYNAKAEANVVPVSFQVGPDVDKVGYTILEGIASGAAIDAEIAAIAKDTIDFKYATFVEAEGKSFTDSIALDKSGIYTLVAVGLDTLKKAQSAASINFKYLATDDQDKVIVSVSASTTEAYASKGYNPDASLAYTISGAGITGAIPMVYSAVEVVGEGGIEKLVSELEGDPNRFFDMLKDEEFTGKLSAGALASANDEGYTDIYTSGVTPGTEYYVIVWATNGYGTAVVYDTMTTTGDPLPVYQIFDSGDYYPAGVLESAGDYIGTWNYYAVDLDGSLGLREYLGKVEVSASETPDSEYTTETGAGVQSYLLFKGLSGGGIAMAKAYGYCDTDDDTVEFVFDSLDELVYVSSYVPAGYANADYASAPFYFTQQSKGMGGWYRATYYQALLPVEDGYYAFVDVSGEGYEFSGWRWLAGGYYWTQFSDALLIDPAKDDNGLAPASVNKAKARLQRSMDNVSDTELTAQKKARAVIDSYMKSYKVESKAITPAGVQGLAPVTCIRRVAAKHTVSSFKSVRSAKNSDAFVQFDMRKKMN